ncbi:hypothetical protein PPERSA_08443 [Pseudocohnilembus persalinus]|uniref:Leucine-rich repeat, cysteine-containing subtype n=1 Tax=Pseudocohnilembus persalinus TaxID=266149 RepID=A0A0V0R7A4_PSEPJ|nr:hypothetical protein PPERSA_08443 [Pseudocohnilembus persalinus]|eukprot:KRX10040.1 hypothetical protein PPERSA_08443 [Pseudocohnilembus persalinus]
MFRIPNIQEQLQGLDKITLDVIDDQEIGFMLKDKWKENWEKIDKISIKNSFCTIKFIESLAASPFSEKLRELNLSQNFQTVNDNFVQVIYHSKYLKNLQCIDFSDTDISDYSLELIGSETSDNFKFLNKLILYGCLFISDQGIQYLSECEHFQQNTSLQRSNLSDLQPNFYGIKYLDLRSTGITDTSIKLIAKSDSFRFLEYLDLSLNENNITDIGMNYFRDDQDNKDVEETKIYRLKVLKLENCRITDQGVLNLTRSKCMTQLEELDISNSMQMQNQHNKITSRSLELLTSPNCEILGLKKLNLRATLIDSRGLQLYVNSENSQELEEIRVTFTNINSQFLYDVIDQSDKNLKKLKKISINDTLIDDKDIKHFLASCPNIELIYSSTVNFTRQEIQKEIDTIKQFKDF